MHPSQPARATVMKMPIYGVKSMDKGFALVLVLWVLSLLTIMAGSFALTMRRESSIMAGIKDNAAAVAAAEAGVAYAEMMLLQPDQNKSWRADGNVYQVDFGDTHVRLRLVSEAGKIDVNKADLALLQGLMSHAPIEEDQQAKIIGAILDWRDQDDLLNIDGAEKNEYRKANLKYAPRNKPFQTLEELQMVLGMNERLYKWLLPVVTIHSGQPKVNLKLATPKVLAILPGLDASMIANFVETRLESDKTEQPIPEFPATLLIGNAIAGGGGDAITIVSEARMTDDSSAVITATVSKSGGGQALAADLNQAQPYKILRWQRNPADEEPLFGDQMNELLVRQYGEPELSN